MRAVIYARYSSENQHEASIEDQVRNATRLVAEREWRLQKVYADRAISGATTLRPDFQALLSDAAAHQFDVVVSEGLDRLSRDPESMAGFFKKMSFYGIAIVTRSEGEITDLHVGFKGVMNAVALKDLAIKTHRGIEGRVRQGKSGGGRAYGYRTINERDANGDPVRGRRQIDPAEADIVRRIFREFAAGASPRAIAIALNADQIPSPGGKGWRDTTIRGHATRRTGILRNDLYVGRLLWNKQTYVRDPVSGKRLARVRKPDEQISVDVPDLRIVEQHLWDAVQARLDHIRSSLVSSKIRTTEFWKARRPKHLLTGLIRCGTCGGTLEAVGKDYLACRAARSGGSCQNRSSVKRKHIEQVVLEGLKSHLMAPELVKEFIRGFHEEANRAASLQDATRQQNVVEFDRITKKIRGLYDAIADGLRTPGLQQELLALERR